MESRVKRRLKTWALLLSILSAMGFIALIAGDLEYKHLIVYSLMGVVAVGLWIAYYFHHKKELKELQSFEENKLQTMIYNTAKKYDGTVTVNRVLSIYNQAEPQKIEAELMKLAAKNYARMDYDEEGQIFFYLTL